MSDYWYTDKQGRKRHVDGFSSEVSSSANSLIFYEKSTKSNIPNLFSQYSINFTKSKLHLTSCPVCSQAVYFCECDNGGKVFFETLSPTWKKHPCTTHYDTNQTNKTYYLIIPKEKAHEKIILHTPEFMENFTLNFHGIKFYDNLINNCTLLVRKHKNRFLLTIIVNNANFSNKYLCEDKKFYKQFDIENFIKKFYAIQICQQVCISKNLRI